jgi:hypothetical protein
MAEEATPDAANFSGRLHFKHTVNSRCTTITATPDANAELHGVGAKTRSGSTMKKSAAHDPRKINS